MSHFAKVENGVVTQVIVADQSFIDTYEDSMPGVWIQCSYNTLGNVHYAPNSNEPDGGVALRANFGHVGYTYDTEHDVFYPPRPGNKVISFNSCCLSKFTFNRVTSLSVFFNDKGSKSPVSIKSLIRIFKSVKLYVFGLSIKVLSINFLALSVEK